MTTNEQPCGFGEFLLSSRQAKGLSLEQVSEQTKIPVSKLKELENEDLDKLPAAVFVKGFVKAYAATVGVDAAEAIQLFEKCIHTRLQSGATTSVEPPKKVSSSWSKLIISIVIIVLLAFAIVRYGTNFKFGSKDSTLNLSTNAQNTETSPSATPDSSSETMTNALATEENNTELKHETSTTDVQPPNYGALNDQEMTSTTGTDYQEKIIDSSDDIADMAPAETVRTQNENVPVIKSDSDIGTEKESSSVDGSFRPDHQNELSNNPLLQQSSSGNLYSEVTTTKPEDLNTLSVVALEYTWLKYTIDDFQTKEITLKPGAELILKSKASIELFVGNAGGIKLKYNDQDMGVPGKTGQVLTIHLP